MHRVLACSPQNRLAVVVLVAVTFNKGEYSR